jgi:hypothetical protein
MKKNLNFNHRTEVEILLSSMTCTFHYISIYTKFASRRKATSTSIPQLSLKTLEFPLKLPRAADAHDYSANILEFGKGETHLRTLNRSNSDIDSHQGA